MSNLEISTFCMLNTKIARFCIANLEFGTQNIEISRLDVQMDLVTHTGEQEIGAESRRLPDNPGEWAYIYVFWAPWISQVPSKWFPRIFYIL